MIHMVCVALKQFGEWQGGSGGSPPGEEKKGHGDVTYSLRSLTTVQGNGRGVVLPVKKRKKSDFKSNV